LRALASACEERTGLAVRLALPDALPVLSDDAEVALYRTVQEALANVVRHADATSADVTIAVADRHVSVTVTDDGRGLPVGWSPETLRRDGHVGLAGMRERLAALGGAVTVSARATGGVALAAHLPVTDGGAS
jgi:signal transduction histidine kinase